MNVLTFDVEEWFHLLDFDDTRGEEQWSRYEVRIHDNVSRILDILEENQTRGTFFIIGWVAKTYPELVKRIAEKYQIGSHTMTHQLVWQQSREAFRKDVEDSIKLLQDITGQPIKAFRAPGFSIRESEAWAFEELHDMGIEYDCSVFPAAHAHGGIPSYSEVKPSIIRHNGAEIKEFPVSIKTLLGKNIIFSGGGYFRLFPYPLIKRWSRQSPEYVLSYIHPRDLDAGQPMLEGLPLARKFKSYVGLKGAEAKLRRYLHDFDWGDLEQASAAVDWSRAPIIKL